MTDLAVVVDQAVRAVAEGGVAMLGVMMLAEGLFPPIPSEAVLPMAGVAVEQGRMSLLLGLVAATAGSTAGAWVLYAGGRLGGRTAVYRYHEALRLRTSDLDRADAWFDRYGPALVFWARMVPLARSAVSVPAGMAEMPALRFTALTVAGSLLWNAVLIGAGIALGRNWHVVERIVGRYTAVIAATVAVLAIALVARRLLRRSEP
ncbi:MAG TPA: DedA family protein [Euzebyales bacterium]|nr:DedA family protein [Euzebyales bacterium]